LAPLKNVEEKIQAFTDLRYHKLSEKFPHKPFSTEQGQLDFFQTTLDYLNDSASVNEALRDKNILEYGRNYLEWIKRHL
jgi:hypothetical protein